MSKSFKSVFSNLTGFAPKVDGRANNQHSHQYLTADVRKKGHEALRNGLMVFLSKDILDKLEVKFGTRPTSRLMRQFVEEIAKGTLKVGNGQALHSATTANGHGNGSTITEGRYTLQQAARVLGCRPAALYIRARQNRIAAVREGSRYILAQSEIDRLKEAGL